MQTPSYKIYEQTLKRAVTYKGLPGYFNVHHFQGTVTWVAIKARSELFLEHYLYSDKIVFIEVIVAGMLFWAKTREKGLSINVLHTGE